MFIPVENKKQRPLFANSILFFVLFITAIFIACADAKKAKTEMVNPQIGDVFLVKDADKKATAYYFIKVSELWEDSIIFYHSSFEYNDQVNEFDKEDFFVLDEQLIFTKKQLQTMFEKDKLMKIDREYGSNDGFERMKY